MTEDGYKPFLQARSDVATEFSKVKVVRGKEDFLIFVAWFDGNNYHHKKYTVDTCLTFSPKKRKLWQKPLDIGLNNDESETDC